MRWSGYRRGERRILNAEGNSIVARWAWGRTLLADTARMTESGLSLRHGELDKLLNNAKGDGLRLNAQEIQRRLRAARAYETEAEIRIAGYAFGTWRELAQAGFPPVEVDEPEPVRERTVDTQGSFWPLDHYDDTSSLADLDKHATSMEQSTSDRQRKDQFRREYLERLTAAVFGDLSKTWGAAVAAAGGEPEQLNVFLAEHQDVDEDS